MRNLFATTAVAAMTLAGAAAAQTATTDATTTDATAAADAAAPAAAATQAKAGTDLNIRSGPGVQHEVIGVIPGGADVSVAGCIDAANWCEVTHDETSGWAYGDYLAAEVGEEFQPIYPNRQALNVAVIQYTGPEAEPGTARRVADTGAGAAAGAAAGALVAGPLGAVIGAAVGGASAQIPAPAPEVLTYIEANPQPPVVLKGEVVIGAGVPETVTLYDIPEVADYRYVTINGQPVLVDAERRIVHIYR